MPAAKIFFFENLIFNFLRFFLPYFPYFPTPEIFFQLDLLMVENCFLFTSNPLILQSKAIPGVRMAFQLQCKCRTDPTQVIRGLRSNDNPLNSSTGSTASTSSAPGTFKDFSKFLWFS